MTGRYQRWQLRSSVVAAGLAVMTATHGCQCDYRPIKFTADGGNGDGGSGDAGDAGDAGPQLPAGELAVGDFWNIYSGIAYPDAGGAVLHAIVGEDAIQPQTEPVLGDLALIQVSPPGICPLSTDHLAYINGAVVSPAPPERVLFLDNFNSVGVSSGTLMMTDLSAVSLPKPPSTSQLSKGTTVSGLGVRPFSYWFGRNGNEILFIDDLSGQTATGTLVWTDGNGTYQVIGTGATPGALVLSADRSHAVAAINVGFTAVVDGGTVDPDLGSLVWIDLSNGSTRPLASAVTALPHEHYCPAQLCDGSDPGLNTCGDGCACVSNVADGGSIGGGGPSSYCACAVPPSCSYLNQSPEMMFSSSVNGLSIAYESPVLGGSYSISIATVGNAGVETTLIGEGQFPGLSGDGQQVAFFDPSADGESGALQVRDSMGNLIVTTPAVGVAPPRFSPDGQAVAFAGNYRVQGMALSRELADVWLIPSLPAATAVPYATNAAWKSLTFWPATGTTEQVSVLAQVADSSGVVTLTDGTGNLQVDDLSNLFASGALPSQPIAANLDTLDFGLLPASGGFALSDNGTLGVWLPSSTTARRPGTFSDLGNPIAYGTLQTSAVVPSLNADEVTFVTSMTPCQDCEPPGPLWGGSLSPVQHLKDNVTRTALTPDGRVLALVQDSASRTEVWLLSLTGSP